MKIVVITLFFVSSIFAKIVFNNYELESIINNNYSLSQDLNIDITFLTSNSNKIESFNTLANINQNSVKEINKIIYDNFFVSSINKSLSQKELIVSINGAFDLKKQIEFSLIVFESILKSLNIKYLKDKFDIEKEIQDLGYLIINDKIKLNLNIVKDKILFLPLKFSDNQFVFTKNFGKIISFGYTYEVYVKGKLITTISSESVNYSDSSISKFDFLIDAEDIVVDTDSTVDFKYNFLVKSSNNYRVNIIGFRSRSNDESSTIISYNDLDSNFSIDKNEKIFRVEFYDNENSFLGLVTLRKIGI